LDTAGPAPAPVTMLSGCLTGRGRQLRTGELQGFVPALLSKGSPGVIAATYLVGEEFVPEFADLVYALWQDRSLGAAVRDARNVLAQDGYHPAVWCSYVLYGSPSARASAPHASEATTWCAAALRFIATGSQRHREIALELLRADRRLSEHSRAAVARDFEALAGEKPGYFDEDLLHEDLGLGAFSEALLVSTCIREFGLLRHGKVRNDASMFGAILMQQRICGDSYLLVAAAVELRKRSMLYLEGEGKAAVRRARSTLEWLSAEPLKHAEETLE
jgi:hypothetical protein